MKIKNLNNKELINLIKIGDEIVVNDKVQIKILKERPIIKFLEGEIEKQKTIGQFMNEIRKFYGEYEITKPINNIVDSAYLYSIKSEEFILNKAENFNNDTNIN